MLLKDLINIPDSVRQGDLVFKISDATEDAKATLDQYVVTEQLEESFIQAVRLVGAAVNEGSSKAAYLSGSFGSGKSSFMGVLQLLLDRNPDALAKPELADVVAELNRQGDHLKILTVPYHLIGATSLESAVFGGYVEHVRAKHPDAPYPAVFADEPLLANADDMRARFGDDAFFAQLGEGDEGWGELSGWDAARYDAARAEPVGGPERRLLVQAMLEGPLSSFADAARANREGYVDMEQGLAAISEHAHSLGYNGLILFLDELILWLMSQMANQSFVSAEASKLSKLVEGSDADRPAPLIALVSRQRDLRDLVGHDVPGSEQLSFIGQLDYQAGRFSTITLNDSNLPVVAHNRLLRPKDDTARTTLQQAFTDLNLDQDERDTLRGTSGTDDDFALTYPFSPAFLNVVVDVASALQRTRTGLRVLLELLVDKRDTIEIGDLVPLGDLYDVLAEGDDPLTDELRQNFRASKRLYDNELRPMLLDAHNLGRNDEPTPAFRNDDRFIKTLLLAALVPNSEPFKNLTAKKLVALNHGLITTPVPGTEVQALVRKLTEWSGRIAELQVGSDVNNPTINIVLSEVDVRSILQSVRSHDSTGTRRQLLRDMIAEELKVATDQQSFRTTLLWKGVQREIDLRFGNIRNHDELPDAAFEPDGDRWQVVIDFPFDEQGHTPLEDLERIDGLRANNWQSVCWLPSFFTADFLGQVGDLVLLNHLIPIDDQMSERFRDATRNLSPDQREAARPQMQTWKLQLRNRLQDVLKQAYGLKKPEANVVDSTHGLADHFPTLLSGLSVQPPVAATLRDAFDAVIRQALAYSYPDAPDIEGEVKAGDLRTVLGICTQALEQPDNRVAQVESSARKAMARIANPLKLGTQSEQAFRLEVATNELGTHFTRKLAERDASGAAGNPTVRELRAWIDDPKPRGLTRALQNLIILVWAAATDRTFQDHGGPAAATLDTLRDDWEVVGVDLPDAATWQDAVQRAQAVFGTSGLMTEPSSVGLQRIDAALSNAAGDYGQSTRSVVERLASLDSLAGVDGVSQRTRTAECAAAVVDQLASANSALERLQRFAAVELEPSAAAIGASIKSSAAISAQIDTLDMRILASAMNRGEGASIRQSLVDLVGADELATRFVDEMRRIDEAARSLVLDTPAASAPAAAAAAAASPVAAATADAPSPDDVAIDVPSSAGTVVAEHKGLDRSATQKALKDLRDRIKSGELSGSRFDIRVVALDGDDE